MTGKIKAPSDRTRLKRAHERGAYDLKTINAILDAMPLCHVSYVLDGAPVVTPTLQWRQGRHVYWHGSSASRMIKTVEKTQACMAVTILDGFVMARSAFHHSVNYRSVMLFGTPEVVSDRGQAETSLKAMMEGLFPGRWETLRPILDKELKATTILSMPISEASAKVRTGMPVDDEPDYDLPIWAGVVPVAMKAGPPVSDPRNCKGVTAPTGLGDIKLG